RLKELSAATGAALGPLVATTTELGQRAMPDPEEAGAMASHYLTLFGLVALAHSWLVQAKHAVAHPGPASETKLKPARYFYAHVLPEIEGLVPRIRAGKAAMMAFDPAELEGRAEPSTTVERGWLSAESRLW